MILPVRLRYQEKTLARIERRLPGPGKTLVRSGDTVEPTDLVGQAEIGSGFRKIDLRYILGLDSAAAVKSLLKQSGEVIYKGEPLAKTTRLLGLRRRVYLSPVEGVIEGTEGGEVTIRFAPSEIEIESGFRGQVETVNEGESVVIKTTVAKFSGVVGEGRERFGHLKVVGRSGEFLLPQHLDSSASGKIVVGGGIVTADTIEKGLAIGVRGLVTGGINFHETLGWSDGSDIGLTILSLEGYGFHQIGSDIFEALEKYDGEYAAIDGESAELMVSVAGTGEDKPAPSWRELRIGDTVRVVTGENLGRFGAAEGLSRQPVELESGLKEHVVTFKSNGEKIMVPGQNLEIVKLAK